MTQSHILAEASISALNGATAGVQTFGEVVRDSAISISGTFVATVTLQRSLDGDTEANYMDLSPSFTSPAEENFINTQAAWYRLKVTAYTSGTVELAIRS